MSAEPEQATCCEPNLLTDGLGEVGLALAVAGFTALWNDLALRPDELVPTNPCGAREVARVLAERGRCELDDDGRVVGVHGLTLRPGRHRFSVADNVHHTWCAFDCIGIPASLGLDALASTDCPACGQALDVPIVGGTPAGAEALVLWLPAPPKANNLRADFCAAADLYCSVEHLERRIDTTTTAGEVTELPAAVSLARDTWADVAKVVAEESS